MQTSPTTPKKTATIPSSFTDQDAAAIDACISLDPMWPPTRSEIICAFVRVMAARVIKGAERLQDVCHESDSLDIAALLAMPRNVNPQPGDGL